MMPNPFTALQPALKVLCSEAEVLPATGQAMVDLINSDEEEIHDRHVSGTSAVSDIWETSARSLHREIRPIYRNEAHRLRYFADGSARTYFIGTLLEKDRSSPVQISQVGAALVRRENNGRIRVVRPILEILLTVERSQVSENIWANLEKALAGLRGFKLCDSAVGNLVADQMNLKEARPRGAHRANWHMRQLERELATEVARETDEWLVIDGSLGNEFETWKGAPLISIAKTFSRDNRFDIGRGPRANKLNLFSLLKGMDRENQRSVVFSRSDEGKILFWYVRIRPQRGLDYPLMGVVKIELPNPNRQPVESDWIDEISGWVAAERSVTPYGHDARWHAHIYPIYIAERVIRSQFHSEEVLKAGIRWPFPEPILP